MQKLSLTSSHGGSPPLVNTKERNGSLSLACTSPEEPEEPDARVRGVLESGEEDGEVQPMQSTSPAFGGVADSHTAAVEHPVGAGMVLLMPRPCGRRR